MLDKVKSFFKQFFLIIFFSFALLLICDFFLGDLILKKLERLILKTQFYDRLLRVKNLVYHHELLPNMTISNGRGFNGIYSLCTDNHGFKSKCGQNRGKDFEYGFIGDSFTEAVGVSYENSFTGLFENFSKRNIANLGVVTYSPKIYLSKLNYLLNQRYKFKHIIVFIDISDLYDDNVSYDINEKLIVTDKKKTSNKLSKKIINFYKEHTPFNRDNFPVTNFYLFVLKQSNLFNTKIKFEKINNEFSFNKKANLKAKWTYSVNQINGYQGSIKEAQQEMIGNMNRLYEILKKNNIKMSLAVYPWPHQILFDSRNSKHVMMWKDFCKNKCDHFINTFDVFFDEIEKTSSSSVVKKYYFENDVHFNEAGNKLIFEELKKYLN